MTTGWGNREGVVTVEGEGRGFLSFYYWGEQPSVPRTTLYFYLKKNVSIKIHRDPRSQGELFADETDVFSIT